MLANECEKSDRGKPGLAQVERQLKRQIRPAYSLQPLCTIMESSRTTSGDRVASPMSIQPDTRKKSYHAGTSP
jgi:hypothetical protein